LVYVVLSYDIKNYDCLPTECIDMLGMGLGTHGYLYLFTPLTYFTL